MSSKQILILTLFTFILYGCKTDSKTVAPHSEKGVIDFSAINLQDSGIVKLDGEWQFYQDRFIMPGDFSKLSALSPQFVKMPHSWDGNGFGTYRIKVKISEKDIGQKLTIQSNDLYSAAKIFINEIALMQVGKASETEPLSTALYDFASGSFTPDKHYFHVVVHVSNFEFRVGGILKPFNLASQGKIESKEQNLHTMNMILLGSLLIMFLYHIGLYFIRKKDRSPLYFGLMIMCVFLRTLIVERYLYRILEGDFELVLKIEYISLFMLAPAFAYYISSIYPDEFNHILKKILLLISSILSLLTILLPGKTAAHFIIFFQIITLMAVIYVIFAIIKVFEKDGKYNASIEFTSIQPEAKAAVKSFMERIIQGG